ADGTRENRLVDRGYAPNRPVTKLHRVGQEALASIGLETRHEGVHTFRRGSARILFDRLVAERGYDGALRVTSSLLHHTNGSTTESYLGLAAERRTRDQFMRGPSILGPKPSVEPSPNTVVTSLRGRPLELVLSRRGRHCGGAVRATGRCSAADRDETAGGADGCSGGRWPGRG